MIYGVPAQITSTGAVSTTVRSLTPDDADLNNINQKRFGVRYTLLGTTSLNSDVYIVHEWCKYHLALESQFKAHQAFAAGNVSIQELITLQTETFAFLTATGFTFNSNSIGTVSNVLIKSFDAIPDYELNKIGGGNELLTTWKMVLETTNFAPLSSNTQY